MGDIKTRCKLSLVALCKPCSSYHHALQNLFPSLEAAAVHLPWDLTSKENQNILLIGVEQCFQQSLQTKGHINNL